MKAAFEVFKERIAPYKPTILEKHQIVSDLGEKMKEIRQEALQSFDKSASRYNQSVYQKKRIEMLAKLNTQLGVFFVGQLNNLHKKATILFEENLQKGLKTPRYNFAKVVSGCLDDANTFFLNGAKGKYEKSKM